jgi:hypothetical protein
VGTSDRPDPAETKNTLKAVHDDDLVAYLSSLGVDTSGSAIGTCKFCRDEVTLDNLAAIFPESGALKLVCDRRECLLALQGHVLEGKVHL